MGERKPVVIRLDADGLGSCVIDGQDISTYITRMSLESVPHRGTVLNLEVRGARVEFDGPVVVETVVSHG